MFSLRTYIFFISLVVSVSSICAQATQEENLGAEEKRIPFIRVGIDPTRFALTFLQTAKRGGVEVSLDSEFFQKFYTVAEGGYTFAERVEDNYELKVNGFFGRLGFDYNLLTPVDARDHDAFFMGLRFAGSKFNQEANKVYYENRFGSVTTSVPSETLKAYWSEITVGVKVEAFKNFYVGWTGRGKLRFRNVEALMEPYVVPGYGRINPTSNFTADMNLYISYAFSL